MMSGTRKTPLADPTTDTEEFLIPMPNRMHPLDNTALLPMATTTMTVSSSSSSLFDM